MIIYFDDLTLQIWTASEIEAKNKTKLQTRILDNVKLAAFPQDQNGWKEEKSSF